MAQSTRLLSSTFYVGEKLSKIRCHPFQTTIATGSWDSDQHNKVSLWKLVVDEEKLDFVIASEHLSKGDVTDLQFYKSNNNVHLVSTSSYGYFTLFGVGDEDQSLVEVSNLKLHKGAATCLDVHQEGEVITGGEDGKLNVITLERDQNTRTVKADGTTINSVKYLSRTEVVAASTSNQLRFWDLRANSLKESKTMKEGSHNVLINCVAQHPHQPHYIATGSSEGGLSIWDTRQTLWPINRTKVHKSDVWEISFHPMNPSYLISSSADGTALLWDFNSNKDILQSNFKVDEDNLAITQIVYNPVQSAGSINSFDIDSSSNTIFCCSDNESVYVTPLFS